MHSCVYVILDEYILSMLQNLCTYINSVHIRFPNYKQVFIIPFQILMSVVLRMLHYVIRIQSAIMKLEVLTASVTMDTLEMD